MTKFLIHGNTNTATLTYGNDGYIFAIEIMEVSTDLDGLARSVSLHSFLDWVPVNLSGLKSDWIDKPHPKLKVTEIAHDLSFQAFWDAFDYKMGNRSRVEAAWAKMSTEDKNACILSLKKYKTWKKQNPNIAHMYGETYLNQRRWENEYKIN